MSGAGSLLVTLLARGEQHRAGRHLIDRALAGERFFQVGGLDVLGGADEQRLGQLNSSGLGARRRGGGQPAESGRVFAVT